MHKPTETIAYPPLTEALSSLPVERLMARYDIAQSLLAMHRESLARSEAKLDAIRQEFRRRGLTSWIENKGQENDSI